MSTPSFRRTLTPIAAALVLIAPTSARAQQPGAPPPATPVSAEVRRAVVDSLAAAMSRFYAVGDTGALVAQHLRRRLASGAYDAITNRQLFAEAVTTDMKSINGDRHLALFPSGTGPVFPMGQTTLPRLGGGPGINPANVPPQVLAAAQRVNFNLGRVEVLPGNVGYFEMRGFSPLPQTRDAVVSALEYLKGTDAVILDVRDHTGGSGELSNFVISHFTGADTLASLTLEVRAASQRSTRYTLAKVPGPRRADVPLFVLTSRGTVSAGEDVAFVLKNLGRATLVGETTTGAGRNNPSFDVGHGFVASISVSRVTDPKTGAEWEGVGVVPHVPVAPRRALPVAHARALRAVAERETAEQRKRDLALTVAFVEAQAAERRVNPATLARYAGTYGGERTITVEDGRLVFRRFPERLGQELTPIADTLFALGPLVRIAFEPDGEHFRLRAIANVGESLAWRRTGPAAKIPSERD